MAKTNINEQDTSFFQKADHFLRREYSGDALRNTCTTVIPAVILYFWTDLNLTVPVTVGALLASLTDIPGNRQDKWLSARWCISSFFVSSLLTAAVMGTGWLTLLWLITAAFSCSMLLAHGTRIYTVGLLNLILISFSFGFPHENPLLYGVLVSLGAFWHFVISTILIQLMPYRSLQHALDDNIESLSLLLSTKSNFYNEYQDIKHIYQQVSALHIKVSDQQDNIRHLLLRESNLVMDGEQADRILLRKAYNLMDLYELLSAIDYDYTRIRSNLGPTGALPIIRQLIDLISDRIHVLSSRTRDKKKLNYAGSDDAITYQLHKLSEIKSSSTTERAAIIHALLININDIMVKIEQLKTNSDRATDTVTSKIDYSAFLTVSNVRLNTLVEHIRSRSTVFLFAARIACIFAVAGIFILLFPDFKYGYWMLLTIAIVARPTYAVTQQRNRQRLLGTGLGILSSLLILSSITDPLILSIGIVISLFGFFLFNQPYYMVSVIFATLTIIGSLYLMENSISELTSSRSLFTVGGTYLALLGWYFFPVKQHKSILALAQYTATENKAYFETVKRQYERNTIDSLELRLHRKRAHTALAQFSDTLQQLQIEPHMDKWLHQSLIQVQYNAYRINAHIVGLAVGLVKNIHSEPAIDYVTHIDATARLLSELEAQVQELETAQRPVKKD